MQSHCQEPSVGSIPHHRSNEVLFVQGWILSSRSRSSVYLAVIVVPNVGIGDGRRETGVVNVWIFETFGKLTGGNPAILKNEAAAL